MYKVFQIIEGCSEVELNLEDSKLVTSCISGQIYDSDPVDFADDLGARFALHRSIRRMPASSKLLSLFAKGCSIYGEVMTKFLSALRGRLLVRQSFFHDDTRMFDDVGGGVTAVKGFYSNFRPTHGGLSLNMGIAYVVFSS